MFLISASCTNDCTNLQKQHSMKTLPQLVENKQFNGLIRSTETIEL